MATGKYQGGVPFNPSDKIRRVVLDAADALDRVFSAWASELPPDERQHLDHLIERGWRPGMRVIGRAEGKPPVFTLLLVDRAGEFHVASEVKWLD